MSLATVLGVSLLAFVFFLGFIPATQAKPQKCTIEVYFNHDFWDNQALFIWNGTISGDIEGVMTFWATGYGGPGRDVGNVHFFTEHWIIENEFGKIMGDDTGLTGYANWRYRMNSVVDYADGIYEDLVGHQVHMDGQITWFSVDEFGRPATGVAIGPVRIN
ncbi:MAG: hypothetical protein ACFE9O_12790 [Promethearchaeota archaeon]